MVQTAAASSGVAGRIETSRMTIALHSRSVSRVDAIREIDCSHTNDEEYFAEDSRPNGPESDPRADAPGDRSPRQLLARGREPPPEPARGQPAHAPPRGPLRHRPARAGGQARVPHPGRDGPAGARRPCLRRARPGPGGAPPAP